MKNPQVLFEVSWEVCNPVGGIHTVIASKAQKMLQYYGNLYFCVGPDISRINDSSAFREELWDPEFMNTLSSLNIECRMGKWLIPGQPRTLLVNFGKLHQIREKILAEYWETYKLHSLYGGWDYLEPLFFGHAAGTVIEHLYYRHFKPRREKIVVQCHDWTSSAAILYLKKAVPEIASVFTTHATALGRSLAGHQREINLAVQAISDPKLDKLAHEMGVSATHSLESISATIADCFTTTSALTAEQCLQIFGRKPDVLLFNGISEEFVAANKTDAASLRRSRNRLYDLAELTTGVKYDQTLTDVFITSGRYEYHNKGIDLLLDSLKSLNEKIEQDSESREKKRVITFLVFPANHSGPNRQLLNPDRKLDPGKKPFLTTHDLRDEPNDPIVKKLNQLGLTNQAKDAVHVIFVPIYLGTKDALIHENYYQLLRAADLSVFPSWYEPWGYSQLESIALGVPTVSSDLSGFGRWALDQGDWQDIGVAVLKRQGRDYTESCEALAGRLLRFLKLSPQDRLAMRKAAVKTSLQTHWKNWGRTYYQSHAIAIERVNEKTSKQAPIIESVEQEDKEVSRPVTKSREFDPSRHMRNFIVLNKIPRPLEKLRVLSKNVWWDWHPEALELFSKLDPVLWSNVEYNPSVFLDYVKPDKLEAAATSAEYLKQLELVFEKYESHVADAKKSPSIAFFCAEYGITSCLKFYSGGLGILAGDIVKTASDLSLPMCAVGLAYQLGYFQQRINREGNQQSNYIKNDFYSLPMQLVCDSNGQPIVTSVQFPSGPVYVRGWKIGVGNIGLYLLDTDFDANRPADRAITNILYGGDKTHRLRQEFVLGIGGYQFLKAIGISPTVYHMNEGHSAFLVLARLSELVQEKNLKLDEAMEFVRQTSIFTTHTPVPAGHDYFHEDIIRPYLGPFEEALRKDWVSIMGLGQAENAQADENARREFSVTHLCLHASNRVNGVSKIHGVVSRKMFHQLYPGFHEHEVPVTSITNGVHVPTWLAPEWHSLFSDKLGPDWSGRLGDEKYWEKVRDFDSKSIWKAHQNRKKSLIEWLRDHVETSYKHRRENPATLALTLNNLDPDKDPLIVGFARRFAPYKRAHLLFHDVAKLQELLTKTKRPVIFVFSGKAHPSDGNGQAIIRKVIELSRHPALAGKIIFIENYEISIAWRLVSGCDVWLNTPTRPLEASGTSGIKAGINGCLNFSVADGWWAEGYNGHNGWVIGETQVDEKQFDEIPQDFQNEYDSSRIYSMFEHTILPAFDDRSSEGIPEKWVAMMKESMASIIPRFSSARMVQEYNHRFYRSALAAGTSLSKDGYAEVVKLYEQKQRLVKAWDSISFLDVQLEGLGREKVFIDQPVVVKIELSHPELASNELQVEAVIAKPQQGGNLSDFRSYPLELIEKRADAPKETSTWKVKVLCKESGPYSLGVRVLPKKLADQQLGFFEGLIKWL